MSETTERGSGRMERERSSKTKRSEVKQAERTRKKEDARKANQLKNRERVRTGKAQKADPGTIIKPSIWEKMAEDRVYHMLREIGDTTKNIDKFQRKRVLMALFIAAIGIPAGMFLHVWLYLAGPIAGFVFYKMKAKSITNYYRAWKFERQLNFSKFTRLVIPYLKASGGTTALYTIFNKILKRTEDEADRRSLYQLMGEMGDNPADIQPFLDYAERSSGTDMSHLFMSTIFDFQQSTFDTQVIDELGKMAGDDMMNAIDEIINMKLKRFTMFPTKVVMLSFILVVGLGAGLMIDSFKDLDMGGGKINPADQMEKANAASESDATPVIAEEDKEEKDEPAEDAVASVESKPVDWQSSVNVIATNKKLSKSDKWQQVALLANQYAPTTDELSTFEGNMRKEYMTSMYTADLDNHEYTLSNGFQSHVLKNSYENDKKNPTYTFAMTFWTNTYFTYVKGERSEVTANEDKANALLVNIDGACSIKGDGNANKYHVAGDPLYDETKVDKGSKSDDKMFCTVREAVNDGFAPAVDTKS